MFIKLYSIINYNCNLQTIDNYHVRHKIIIGICGIIIVTSYVETKHNSLHYSSLHGVQEVHKLSCCRASFSVGIQALPYQLH